MVWRMLPNNTISWIEAQFHLASRLARAGGFGRVVRPTDRQITLFPQWCFALFRASQRAKRAKRPDRLERERNTVVEKVLFVWQLSFEPLRERSEESELRGLKGSETPLRKKCSVGDTGLTTNHLKSKIGFSRQLWRNQSVCVLYSVTSKHRTCGVIC